MWSSDTMSNDCIGHESYWISFWRYKDFHIFNILTRITVIYEERFVLVQEAWKKESYSPVYFLELKIAKAFHKLEETSDLYNATNYD